MKRTFRDSMDKAFDRFGGTLRFQEQDVAIEAHGFVTLTKIYNGVRETVFEDDENLVVTMARRFMSRMLSGAVLDSTATPAHIQIDDPAAPGYPGVDITAMTQLALTKIKWGTGGHNPALPTEPIPPLATDEKLADPLVSPAFKPVIVDYTDLMQVRFTATLEQGEANGQAISEVGLFTESHDLMFCRKTFGMLTKSSAFAFEFQYTIVF